MIGPVAIDVGGFSIRWYGICAALGLLAGYQLLVQRCGKYGIKQDQVTTMTYACMFAAIVGARLAYVIRFWSDEFAGRNLLEILMIHHGGLVFYGGFILAAVVGLALCLWKKWNIADMADLMAPALAAAHAIGRIGCLINGCCFGRVYDGLFAVHYPPLVNNVLHIQKMQGLLPAEATISLPTFPIEAVACFSNLAICCILLWMEKCGVARKRLFLVYAMIYAVTRFLTEFGRGDYLLEPGQLTPAQVTCLWIFPVATAIFICLWIRDKSVAKGQDK